MFWAGQRRYLIRNPILRYGDKRQPKIVVAFYPFVEFSILYSHVGAHLDGRQNGGRTVIETISFPGSLFFPPLSRSRGWEKERPWERGCKRNIRLSLTSAIKQNVITLELLNIESNTSSRPRTVQSAKTSISRQRLVSTHVFYTP